MKCFKCGEEINDALFCPFCGADNRAQIEKETLTRLVTDTQSGDKTAANDLLSYAYPFMFNTARCIAKNDSDAQDITQEASIKILKSISSLNNPNTFKSWANTIVRNTAIDFLGKASNIHDIHFTDLDNPDDGLSYDPADERITSRPDLQMSDNARKEIVLEVLDSLKEEQRVIAMMYFYQGMSYKEIAEELHIKESTVTGRLNTAKKNIRASVETIQKRDDIKLYNLSPVAWFIWLLRGWRDSAEERGSQVLHKAAQRYSAASQAVQNTAGKAVTSSVSHQTAQTVSTAASAAAVTAASVTGMSVAAKAGIAAAVVAIGGAAIFGVSRIMKKPDPAPEPVAETAPEETPEQLEETSDQLAAVWVHEPGIQIDEVYELKTMVSSIEYNDNEKHRIPLIYEQSGYPQTWDHNQTGYTPDSIGVRRGLMYGIYDYSGNVLYYPSIPQFGVIDVRYNITSELLYPKDFWYCPFRYYPVDGALYFLTSPSDYSTYPIPAKGFFPDFKSDYPLSWGGYSDDFFGAFTCNGRIVQLDYGGYTDYYPSEPQFLMNVTDLEYIGSRAYDHITGFSCVDQDGIRYEISGYPFNFVNGYFAMDESLEQSYGVHTFSEQIRIMNGETGEPLNDQIYEDAKFFENGYCPVKKDGKWGFINEQGEEVTDFIWYDVSTLYEGKTYVYSYGSFGVLDLPASLENGKLTEKNVYGENPPVPADCMDWSEVQKIGTITLKADNTVYSKYLTESEIVSEAAAGDVFDVYETTYVDGYEWYRVSENGWIHDQHGELLYYTKN